jgi:hypothetical protein
MSTYVVEDLRTKPHVENLYGSMLHRYERRFPEIDISKKRYQ